ncbi:alanine racemase [Thalassotalea aquiviva]|uniref:alanine racemase n=1 Tax=Thalassotalea aquiviva TaxID=3242415 RepID=UPI00352B4FDC
MVKKHRSASAIIDTQALKENFNTLKQLAAPAKVLTVLKANAYGHGLIRIAKGLPQADAFGVARIDEALQLRDHGINNAIVLLEGFFEAEELVDIHQHDLQIVIHSIEQLEAIEQASLPTPIKVWLKIDTGMHRLGVAPELFAQFYQRLKACSNVAKGLVLMSHLACADDVSHPMNNSQMALFGSLTEHLPDDKTLANSAAVLAFKNAHYQWVRPGLMLYGVSPMALTSALQPPKSITPVMTLYSSVIAIQHIKAGERVGYGGAWTSAKDTRIGVVAIGYGDGYPRHAINGTPVWVNGKVFPLVGRVSMDMITIDLGEDDSIKVGDYAELWGKNLAIEKIADCAQTIPYELLCNITARVKTDLY